MNPVWNALARFTRRNRAVPRYVAMRNAREAQKAVELATGPPPTEAELRMRGVASPSSGPGMRGSAGCSNRG